MMLDDETEVKLTPAQLKALESLLTHGNIAKAARAAKVGRASLYRWMKEPMFCAALDAASAEAIRNLSRNLARLADKATQALDDALDKSESTSVRVRAAQVVIDNLMRLRELVELENRIAELESKQDA